MHVDDLKGFCFDTKVWDRACLDFEGGSLGLSRRWLVVKNILNSRRIILLI